MQDESFRPFNRLLSLLNLFTTWTAITFCPTLHTQKLYRVVVGDNRVNLLHFRISKFLRSDTIIVTVVVRFS